MRLKRLGGSMVALTLLALAGGVPAHAQGTPWRYGAWVQGGLGVPTSDVRDLPGAPSCLREENRMEAANGGDFYAGGELGWRFADLPLEVSARLGIGLASSPFTAEESIGSASDPTGSRSDVVVEYRTAVERLELRLEPVVRWHAVSPLVVSGGLVAVLPLSTTFDQSERLIAPEQATYLDGATERAIAAGSLDAAPWLGLVAGVGMEIPAGTVLLRPEVGGVFALGSPVDGVDWRPHELRIGLAVIVGSTGESTPITPYLREEGR
ncbi:MAG TPA: hypothetical protein VNA88_06745 [Candidatus Kapabacteria bacterium]|nr:hypothetical protein [Candidatus Kapabacteria bacterium]